MSSTSSTPSSDQNDNNNNDQLEAEKINHNYDSANITPPPQTIQIDDEEDSIRTTRRNHEPDNEGEKDDDDDVELEHKQEDQQDKEEEGAKFFFFDPIYYRGKAGQIFFHDSLYGHSLPCGPKGLHFCPGGVRRFFEMNFLLILPLALIFELTILEGYKGPNDDQLGTKYIYSQIIGAVLVLSLMFLHLLAGGTDPGIIPSLNVTEPLPEPRTIISEDGLEVLQEPCKTCRILRPPRSGHCRWCDCCVEMYDHHCGILQVCVGRYNLKFFILWCWTAWVTLGFAVARTVSIMVLDIDWSEDSKTDLGRWRIAACILMVVVGMICFVIANFPTFHYCWLSGILALEKDVVNEHRVFIKWEERKWNFCNIFVRLCGSDGYRGCSDDSDKKQSKIPDFVREEDDERGDFNEETDIDELPEQLAEELRHIIAEEKRRAENGGDRDSNHV